MPLLYLRYVIVALNVGFVVAVAGITLATCLALSLKTIDDNARSAVQRLGEVALPPMDDFFLGPQLALARMQTIPSQFPDHATFPSEAGATDGRASLVPWSRTVLGELQVSRLKYSAVMCNFFDGSFAIALPVRTAGQVWPAVAIAWPANATHLGRAATVHDATGVHSAAMTAAFSGYLLSLPTSDQRIPALRGFWQATYGGGLRSNTGSVRLLPLFFGATDTNTYFALTYVGRIENTTQHQGFGYISVYLSAIGNILTEAQLTPASRVFLFDNGGFVFAASGGLSPFDMTNYTVGEPVPDGCTTTHESRNWYPSSVSRMACRPHITKFTRFPALVEAANADTAFFTGQLGRLRAGATNGQVRKLKGQYVYAEALPSVVGTYGLTLVMVVPEADMLGDAGRILPIVAGATAAAVLIVAALSFALVWAVLRPLGVVAGRMGKAARLEVDPEAVALSPLAEIRGLQEAFVEMRDELDRIRAFVPQSLLRVSTDDDDGGYAHEAGDETETVGNTPTGTTPGRSTPSMSTATTATESGVGVPRTTSAAQLSSGQTSASGFGRAGTGSDLRPVTTIVSGNKSVPNKYAAACRASRKKGLRTDGSLSLENVTVLMVNVVGYHAGLGPGGRLDTERAAGMVECVLAAAQQHRGVVDSFHGDRFTVSFNAARPCANHATRAALAALRIVHELGSAGQRATCGAASGAAFVGNVGSAAMKRFSVVGAVVPQAAVLERLCKVYGARCLVAQRSFQELGLAVALRTHDLVQLPGAGAACLVAEVLREHAAGDADEWMYQLQRQEQAAAGGGLQASLKDRSVAMGNDAWAAIAMGDLAEVRRVAVLLLKLDESAGPHEKLVSARLHDVLGDAEADLKPSPCDLGVFYNNGVCSRTSAI